MATQSERRSWSYARRGPRSKGYAIQAGDKVIGHVQSEGDAEMICRLRRETVRLAALRGMDSRQQRYLLNKMRLDIQALMTALNDVTRVLKRDSRPREVVAVREEVRKILRSMRAKGYSL